METFQSLVDTLSYAVWEFGIAGIPLVAILLLGAGLYLTLRTGFAQIRHFAHGVAVTSGTYDNPDDPGDVSHFAALSTALSATIGTGNVAGVALAIHFGGPGALFWMWVTAVLGMATKFSEVTLAQYYRKKEEGEARKYGTVSGGPMYYIERGLGPGWVWLAVVFALLLMTVSFFTGNAIQANTISDVMANDFSIPIWVSGIVSASLVAAVIIGGIKRIGKVTSILAPGMAALYVLGALVILAGNAGQLLPTLGSVFTNAFDPQAGVAGTGTGAFLFTLTYGVQRGLFSNEAGMGSAPVAHSAAKTDEPVSEGVVALLEPFIDTIVICTLTALVILTTDAWTDREPTELSIGGGSVTYVTDEGGPKFITSGAPQAYPVEQGVPAVGENAARFAWNDVPVDTFYTDPAQTELFTGTIRPQDGVAVTEEGEEINSLYGNAVESGAPLTQLAFRKGLPGSWGNYIVLLCVSLFAVSTSISWSYYGDRCANYLFGASAIMPYRIFFILMHLVGAVAPLATIWAIGDVFLGLVIIPNLIAVLLLSGKLKEITDSYFERKAWRSDPSVAGSDGPGGRVREGETVS
ncbi:MAG: sodium:alanine symporter family protein [Bacteroidetes bacterium QH_9_67_14]|nr:MAG: sodium:alanine symporter family protein [Bacteroidetes bacterium QH_9_67_14]